MKKKQKIIVALSGGVDSRVVESILKKYAQQSCLVWVDGMFQVQYSTASYQRHSLSEAQQLSSLQDYFES